MIKRILQDRNKRWLVMWLAKWLILILALVAWSIFMARVGQKKALETYKGWVEEAALVQRLEIDRKGGGAETAVAEAELLAKVLYGVKENDTDDLRTLCWCVFNRCDNPAFLNDLTEIINQPSQWMQYSPDNPVLENLYQIAREELDAWRSGAHRPCSYDFVFMNWSPSDICLRDAWREGSKTHYWRYGQ